ncbi:ATP-binding cassette domain-containing protein [Sinorhizobium meliloti]|uniref:ABC transporter ATP-binding protein n=2 Tax=Rhizobium meliloti TaxID=382 RepID=UPI000B49BC4B|nr:ABC transporter ATP-binding protein [Sinorhizobium meliloti]TWB00908.1 amino acid/amide ABC transporter ATP-binding protein 2 (HAAT family) [Ensifer sp. SEMIA 134]TWB37353.1 amino acid/amide ABC transporter ATP-binding protein 2 (HAAT family) [Ensifer sp. SEMIA 135]ASQ00512.1 ABC transporter ATP-binding protein [Sinorhizobium meliloti]MDW9360080.1 ABC transporter ATP-binding protein [Sinorhizobium meliloti]MDW9383534.1 ATP-binding cassette domain-containing protein [Sinorhizobium meliloti]
MPAAPLEVDNLSAGYGPTRVLEGISFSVPAGARLAVLGRNGMGKTTLLATLAGQTRRYDGRIRIGDADVTALPSASRALEGLGFVPQARCVFPSLTVEENLFVGLKGRPKTALSEAYEMFPRLYERRRNLGSQLSGGEQQMLSTARSILGRPSVLLLDEPLEGLAPVICEELMKAFAELAKTGDMTILLVEQRIQSALDFADRVIILERGRLAWSGTPEALAKEHATVERLLGVGGLH